MIGETVYIQDYNRRKYDENRELIYAESFHKVVITGETSKSWVCNRGSDIIKINKKDLTVSSKQLRTGQYGVGCALIGEQAYNDHVWFENNKFRAIDLMRDLKDINKLRAIMKILEE